MEVLTSSRFTTVLLLTTCRNFWYPKLRMFAFNADTRIGLLFRRYKTDCRKMATYTKFSFITLSPHDIRPSATLTMILYTSFRNRVLRISDVTAYVTLDCCRPHQPKPSHRELHHYRGLVHQVASLNCFQRNSLIKISFFSKHMSVNRDRPLNRDAL